MEFAVKFGIALTGRIQVFTKNFCIFFNLVKTNFKISINIQQ